MLWVAQDQPVAHWVRVERYAPIPIVFIYAKPLANEYREPVRGNAGRIRNIHGERICRRSLLQKCICGGKTIHKINGNLVKAVQLHFKDIVRMPITCGVQRETLAALWERPPLKAQIGPIVVHPEVLIEVEGLYSILGRERIAVALAKEDPETVVQRPATVEVIGGVQLPHQHSIITQGIARGVGGGVLSRSLVALLKVDRYRAWGKGGHLSALSRLQEFIGCGAGNVRAHSGAVKNDRYIRPKISERGVIDIKLRGVHVCGVPQH